MGRKIPDRELGEPLISLGREERKVLCERTCPWVARSASEWYQILSLFIYFRQREKEKEGSTLIHVRVVSE